MDASNPTVATSAATDAANFTVVATCADSVVAAIATVAVTAASSAAAVFVTLGRREVMSCELSWIVPNRWSGHSARHWRFSCPGWFCQPGDAGNAIVPPRCKAVLFGPASISYCLSVIPAAGEICEKCCHPLWE